MKQGIGFHKEHQPMSKGEAASLVATHPQRTKLEHLLELFSQFDGPSFAAEAKNEILEVELENQESNPKQSEVDPDPKATMVFTVRDEKMLAHVASGFSFDSAMCECRLW